MSTAAPKLTPLAAEVPLAPSASAKAGIRVASRRPAGSALASAPAVRAKR